MRTVSLVSLFIVLSLVTRSSLCWHEMGHMLTARIAQYKLAELGMNPDAYQWALTQISVLQDMAGEGSYPFVECAGWPDKLKSLAVGEMDSWHFANYPVITPGFQANVTWDSQNITNKLTGIYKTLSATPAEKPGRGKAILGKSMMIRFGVHFFGDIHQPLHNADRYSPAHPTGDLGGNLVNVFFNGTKTDLHSIWDAVFDQIPALQSPLTQQDWTTLTHLTIQSYQKYGSSDYLADTLTWKYTSDFIKLAQESHDLAVSTAYNGIEDGSTLSPEYVSAATEVCLKRIHQAGLRLASFISAVYMAMGNNESIEEESGM